MLRCPLDNWGIGDVPILTQSEDWALSHIAKGLIISVEVPILTQSEDWALYLLRSSASSDALFQSSPSPKTGRYPVNIPNKQRQPPDCSNPHPVRRLGAIKVALRICRSLRCSNPHPVRRLGAIRNAHQSHLQLHVPILTQSEDWALS